MAWTSPTAGPSRDGVQPQTASKQDLSYHTAEPCCQQQVLGWAKENSDADLIALPGKSVALLSSQLNKSVAGLLCTHGTGWRSGLGASAPD